MLDIKHATHDNPEPASDLSAEPSDRPTREQAEAAVRTLIRWAGDSPAREGLRDTPARVARAYEEWFAGYAQNPAQILSRTFEQSPGGDDMILLRDIPVQSVCEHHMAAIRGIAHVAYLPDRRIVGISKLARVVNAYSRRLQIQERLTGEIADAIQRVLHPRGVAVVIQAAHECIGSRGARMHGVALVTRRLLGEFAHEPHRREVLAALAL